MKNYCIASIITTYDVTELESQRFMEAVEKEIKAMCGPDDEELESGGRFKSVIVQDYVGSLKNDKGRLGSCNLSVEDSIAELPQLKDINNTIVKDPKYHAKLL